jgi:hypothetical protein
MPTVFSGLTVERALPAEVLAGLFSGQYRLYGGVIRGAAGTVQAGPRSFATSFPSVLFRLIAFPASSIPINCIN